MKTIVIYFDDKKRNKQVIKTSDQFNGDVKSLVEHITCSNLDTRGYVKNFHSFEII